MTHLLHPLLHPRTIAIAGASTDPKKLGSLPLQFLLKFGYSGELYPVSAKPGEIMGRTCYPTLAAIGHPIDLLIIAVAAERIPSLLESAMPGQVRFALVLSSNFAETGAAGEKLQRELVGLALGKDIRIIGPNSVGLVNLWDRVVASISQVFDRDDITPGPVAFVSQSGAIGTAITALAHEQGIGVGYFISTGNEGDLEFSDFCDAFVDDPHVRVIAGYLESVRDGAKFQRAARRALEAGKPIVLLKVGTTDIGRRAVRSHTGALAGSDDVYRTVLASHGIVRAQGVDDLIELLKLFVAYPDVATPIRSCRIAALSHSGGAGVMMADAAIGLGLDMPPPSQSVKDALGSRLPAYAALTNPVDMTANVIFRPEVMASSVFDMAASGEYDAIVLCVNLIWRNGDALADALLALRRTTNAIVSVAWIAGLPGPLARLARGGIPVFGDPVRCIRAVGARLHWERDRRVIMGSPFFVPVAKEQVAPAGHAAQHHWLDSRGIPLAPSKVVQSASEAQSAVGAITYPVVAKLLARSLSHKSDVGGVILGIADADALERAVGTLLAIPCTRREGVLIQKMIEGHDTVELIAGFVRDPVFGPVVLFGPGGIFVEIFRDVIMHPAPFSPEIAARLIRGAPFAPLLQGVRGRAACDVDAFAQLLARLSVLAVDTPSLHALDLNPVVVSPRGAIAVDFRIDTDVGEAIAPREAMEGG